MIVKCWECGKQFEYNILTDWSGFAENFYIDKDGKGKVSSAPDKVWKRVFCEKCKITQEKKLAETKEQYVHTKMILMVERAISALEKQSIDFYEYEEAIKAVSEFAIGHTDKFDSSYEIVAAIVLIHNRIHIKMQYQVGNYRADICLPEQRCLVEVDGERHDYKSLYDSNRDVKIRQALGAEWEIVRIPTKYLDKNAKVLPQAIEAIRNEKQKIRRENGGIIPAYYSKRDSAKMNEVSKILNRK